MPSFRYRAMTGSGLVVRGTSNATSVQALVQSLRQQGQFPISTSEISQTPFVTTILRRWQNRLSPRLLLMVTQELAALLGAGLEFDRALGMVCTLTNVGSLAEHLRAVRVKVRDGTSFADALAENRIFPSFYVSMVRAGELSGNLAVTLAKTGDYLARSLAVRETITSALVYPVILLVTAGFSIIVILTLVLPEFEPLFAEAGKTLPWPTRIVMGVSDGIRSYWWVATLLILGLTFWTKRRLQRPDLRLKFDTLLLRIPVLGELLRSMEIERLTRTLGTLLAAGVPLPTALRLSSGVLWNHALREATSETAASLREGESLSDRLMRTRAFPPLTIDLIRVGEETGKLDDMLLRQADVDEQRIRHRLDRLLALLVPALTIVLGIVVAGLIASMLVAILSVNDLALS